MKKQITMTCKPFACEAKSTYRLMVGDDGTVRVWDSVAQHYTMCHSLSVRSEQAARRKSQA